MQSDAASRDVEWVLGEAMSCMRLLQVVVWAASGCEFGCCSGRQRDWGESA